MRTAFKKSIITAFAFLLCASFNARAQELIGKLYRTNVPIVVRNVYPTERLEISPALKDSINSGEDSVNWSIAIPSVNDSNPHRNYSKYCEAKKGYIFQVIGIDSNKVIIRWWDFTDSSIARQKAKEETERGLNKFEMISYKNTRLDYEITLADLNSKCSPYFGNDNSFIWGAVTMPIKLRFGNKSDRYFSFQESLNIGIAAGWSWQKQGVHRKSENILFSLGVSNVTLDSLDFKRNAKNESFKPNVKSTAAVTVSGGYVFQFDNFQVGAFIGMDILPYELGRQWLNRGKPWVGVGLGMSLFNRDQAKAGSGKNEEK